MSLFEPWATMIGSLLTPTVPCAVHFYRYDAIWCPDAKIPNARVLIQAQLAIQQNSSLRQDGLIFAISPQPDRAEFP